MSIEIRMHDVVVLTEDTPAAHFETGEPLVLRRGQIGSVVIAYSGGMFEVEFAGREGRAYAILPVPASRLIALRDTPEHAPA